MKLDVPYFFFLALLCCVAEIPIVLVFCTTFESKFEVFPYYGTMERRCNTLASDCALSKLTVHRITSEHYCNPIYLSIASITDG